MIPKELLPAWLQGAFIAGGFAAVPAMAQDVDVWVPVPDVSGVDVVRDMIVEYLKSKDIPFREEDEQTPDRAAGEGSRYVELPLVARRVGTVYLPGNTLPYHVIVFKGTVEDVLNNFDVSTHQVALTDHGVVKGAEWTPPNVPPKQIKKTGATQFRMKKIEERYRG